MKSALKSLRNLLLFAKKCGFSSLLLWIERRLNSSWNSDTDCKIYVLACGLASKVARGREFRVGEDCVGATAQPRTRHLRDCTLTSPPPEYQCCEDPDPPDPYPPDPYVFGPPGSIRQRYGSGSGSFYHHAKIVRKTLIPTILWLFLTFYLWKMMKM